MKTRLLRWLLTMAMLALLLGAAWVWLTLHWSYSEGEHVGYVQKFSRKGWICKTWEGELSMVTMPGGTSEKFEFSVRDDVVAQRINQLAGRRVVLEYSQYRFIPSSCFGETEYFIDGVRELPEKEAVSPSPPAALPAAPLVAPPEQPAPDAARTP